ncbi:methyl-accepting chemotaxis protein [Capsulimonas corticalis]|uniref:Methyl-accepting chemotaxis protein n=1 Tax=Capsulimonas corticalis TaxID=2219043 RepID=A0A402CPW8_9BACT|nr:cache domain-containing protein [Capsulimonas corticalis]BDI32929.1 methyl-accepting chemotaxis protein [Capsulimonas corticalis]
MTPTIIASHHSSNAAESAEDASPERIADLADSLVGKMSRASTEISRINDRTRLLSLNAQIEAARAGGPTGAAFGVVASAMQDLSDKTSQVAGAMATETTEANKALRQIIQVLTTNVRGLRLSDLALTNIDLIDRNLYERSCDVRWWATDSSPVAALAEGTPEAARRCSQRLGVILKSYTVYYDLVVCDLNGRVIANGRPDLYQSVGADCSQDAWFRTALATRSGEEFGFQSVHASPLVKGERVLIYSCCVRANGDVGAAPIGVLGIIFHWDALAQTIVENTPMSAAEKSGTRVCIVDDAGLILADTQGRQLLDRLELPNSSKLAGENKGFTQMTLNGSDCCVGYAVSPGYETYATGWRSLIIQKLDAKTS